MRSLYQYLCAIMDMTFAIGTRLALPRQDMTILENLRVPTTPARNKEKKHRPGNRTIGDSVMELRVQLKVCEGCGGLWYRAQNHCSSYCRECADRLKDFPVDTRRVRRTTHRTTPWTTQRPAHPSQISAWALAETGGAE